MVYLNYDKYNNENDTQNPPSSGLMLPLLIGLGSCANSGNKAPGHPNILVIMTGQQSASMMSCTGNKWLKTPAMDAIATTGIRYPPVSK